MTRISSKSIVFSKRIFPVIWFGFLAVFVAIDLFLGKNRPPPIFFVVPVFMAVIGFVMMKKLVWDLVDEVYDCGDYLLVRNRGDEDKVSLSNIMNVGAMSFCNPPRITLRLVAPCKFGQEVTFSPLRPFTFNPFAKDPVSDKLIVRVHNAKSRRAL